LTHSSDLLAAAMAFGVSDGDLKVACEVLIVLIGELVKQFFWRE
jgi:hypothetical protein